MTQSKSSLKLSKLSLLDAFVFSYYKYAFPTLFLSLLMSLFAETHQKACNAPSCLLRKRHLCLLLPHTHLFLAHLTYESKMHFLLLLSLCIMNIRIHSELCIVLMHMRGLFTAQEGYRAQQGSTTNTQRARSGRLCFANHLTRDDSIPRQACT